MSKRLQDGRWFDVTTKGQHDCLKRYGQLAQPPTTLGPARVQMGEWAGPGRYMLLSYTQPCPRGCCTDSVFEVRSAADVIADARDEMRELAGVLRTARGG